MKEEIEEEWRAVKGYENIYEVSNLGKIRAIDRYVDYMNNGLPMRKFQKGRILVQSLSKGYCRIELSDGKNPKKYFVHRLVAEAFVNKPEGKNIINHLDCVKNNNVYTNLEWTDISGNTKHAYENNLMPHFTNHIHTKGLITHNSQLIIDLQTGIFYDSTEKAAFAKGIKRATLRSWLIKGQLYRTSLRYA